MSQILELDVLTLRKSCLFRCFWELEGLLSEITDDERDPSFGSLNVMEFHEFSLGLMIHL